MRIELLENIVSNLTTLPTLKTKIINGHSVTRHSETEWEVDTLHRKRSKLSETIKLVTNNLEGTC